jgi:uncharacterized membrane protein (DUF485 family)
VSGSTAGAGGRFTRTDDRSPREAAAPDWQAIEGSPEFQELVRARRSFLVPATIVFLVGSLGYLLLAAFDQDFLGKDVGGIPLGFLAALTQVLLTWAITWAYMRRADGTFEPLEQRAAQAATRELEGSAR